MTRLAQKELTPTRPARNPERTRATTVAPILTPEEGDLMKYVKGLEGNRRNPAELLCLLQLAVEADEKDETSF